MCCVWKIFALLSLISCYETPITPFCLHHSKNVCDTGKLFTADSLWYILKKRTSLTDIGNERCTFLQKSPDDSSGVNTFDAVSVIEWIPHVIAVEPNGFNDSSLKVCESVFTVRKRS